jgi:hypothetical protein
LARTPRSQFPFFVSIERPDGRGADSAHTLRNALCVVGLAAELAVRDRAKVEKNIPLRELKPGLWNIRSIDAPVSICLSSKKLVVVQFEI